MVRTSADRMLRSKVLSDLPTTPGQSLVLLVLRSHADSAGVSWPSQRTLAEETGMQRSGVQKALAALLEKGIIQQLDPGSQGSGNSAKYLVKFRGELWATG